MRKNFFLVLAILMLSAPGFARKKSEYRVLRTDSKIVYGICFTNKGGALAIADNETIKVYSTNEDLLLNEFKNGHTRQIISLSVSGDSTLMVSGGKDSTIVLWDFVNARVLKRLRYHDGIVTSVHISNDRKYIVSGGTDRIVFIYDIESDRVIRGFSDHSDDINSVKFSHDGNWIASAGSDKIVNIYSTTELRLVASLVGHKGWVRDIAFSHDSTRLISCGDDSRLITWRFRKATGITLEKSIKAGSSWVLCTDTHPDGRTYATGDINGVIKVFTLYGRYTWKTGVPVNKVLINPGNGSMINLAIATRGKGVLLLGAEEMKSETFR
jgi:WD40 repeat protein